MIEFEYLDNEKHSAKIFDNYVFLFACVCHNGVCLTVCLCACVHP